MQASYSAPPMDAANFGVSRLQSSLIRGSSDAAPLEQDVLSQSFMLARLLCTCTDCSICHIYAIRYHFSNSPTGCPVYYQYKEPIHQALDLAHLPIRFFSTGTLAVALPSKHYKMSFRGPVPSSWVMDESTANSHGPQDGWKAGIRSPGPC